MSNCTELKQMSRELGLRWLSTDEMIERIIAAEDKIELLIKCNAPEGCDKYMHKCQGCKNRYLLESAI